MLWSMHPDSLLFRARLLLVVSILLMLSFYFAENIPAASITAVFVALFIFKFRDPIREIPADPLAVVSPVDGVVVRLERIAHPVLGDNTIQIIIDVSTFGAYILRSPTEGKLIEMPALPVRRRRKTRGLNVRTDEGDDVTFLLHGPWFAPPATSKQLGERVGQGERCGVVRLAHSAEILLPSTAHIGSDVGAQLRAGESILAHFVH